ncbi:hypothetical protein E3N88_25243 [Mikania micrantha]|uniref:BUD13 homolog n=1 Tax=Mikania micrantha TaxID=192012 RepID=A0A5N6N480_9ASTR|nr:hypothetical protein E3N88_25243 [Mikania micrantha]
MVAPSSGSSSLKEYLKRYQNPDEEEKKKKKEKSKTKPGMNGVIVFDEDPVWQKSVQLEEEDEESQDEEKPQVDEDIEVKRMKRLEQLKAQRPFGVISEDGSGWVSVSDNAKKLTSDDMNSDMSPPRKGFVMIHLPQKQMLRTSHHHADTIGDLDHHHNTTMIMTCPLLSHHRPGSHTDLSPPRRKRDDRNKDSVSVSDLSPPRKIRKKSERSKTGLVSGKDIKEEITKTKKEELLRFQNMDPSISGRDAEGIRRDKKTGARLSKEQIKSLQKQDEKPKEIKLEWGKGLAQKREAEARLQELEVEKTKPFARTRDDHDLNNMLKDAVRWGDPMAHLVKKKHTEIDLPDIGDNERMKESGFIVPQQVPNHSWLKRGSDAAPNRYGIKPGRHWDGVDRSNGYEKQLFKRQNEQQATEREAYLWSVADM